MSSTSFLRPLFATSAALAAMAFATPARADSPAALSDIPGLAIWLDATDILATGSNPANETRVQTWKDKANGISFTQGTANNRPTLVYDACNGLPAVRFARNGVTSPRLLLANNALVNTVFSKTNTAFAVAMCSSTGGNAGKEDTSYVFARQGYHSGLYFYGDSNGGTEYVPPTDAGYIHWMAKSSGGNNVDGSIGGRTPYTAGTFVVLSVIDRGTLTTQGASLDFSVNNESRFTSSAETKYFYKQSNANYLRLGASNGSGDYSGGLNGDIAEILVFDRELSAAEQETVWQYLNMKWQIVPFSLACIATGNKDYTASNEVAIASHPSFDGIDAYQISLESDAESLDASAWLAASTPVPATFAFPADTPEGEVTVYFWMHRNSGEVACVKSRINYDTTPPNAIAKDLALDINSVEGYGLSAEDVDDGSNSGSGIFSMSIEPAVVFGPTNVVLTVVNNAGVSACATSTVTIANQLDFHVAADGDDALGDGTAANPFASITRALLSANASPSESARVVFVGPGTYTAATGESFPLSVSNKVSLIGAGKGLTVADAENAGGGLIIADADATAPGLVRGLSLRHTTGNAINAGRWGGTLDDLEISGITSGRILNYNNQLSSRNIVVSGLTVTNAHCTEQQLVQFIGSGSSLLITNCLFSGFSSTKGSGQGAAHIRILGWENGKASHYGGSWPVKIVECTFENFTAPGVNNNESGFLDPGRLTSLIDRCVFSNFTFTSKADILIGPNRAGSGCTVQNTLISNISMPYSSSVAAAIFGGYSSSAQVRNCTIDKCNVVFRPHSGYNLNVYNTSVSDCDILDYANTAYLYLHNVNIHDTGAATSYSADNSAGVTDYVPYYKDAESGDYRLQGMSQLVDAGVNSFAAGAFDVAGTARILDGKSTGNAVVDIGAYEFDPTALGTHFAFSSPNAGIIAGHSATISVWIEPPSAIGPVTATIEYPTNTHGVATLSFPTGFETNQIAISADASFDVAEGTVLPLAIKADGSGIDPGMLGLIYALPRVKIDGFAKRMFLRAGETAAISFALYSRDFAAPVDIPITSGAPEGDGDGAFSWSAAVSPMIPEGEYASNCGLVLTGGTSGSRKALLTLGEGFVFDTNGEPTQAVEIVSFSSPLFVSPEGSDSTGLGTEESPLRTMTYAVPLLAAGETLRLLPGVYGPTDGEVFPVIVPPGIALVGERGETGAAADTSIVDPNATGIAFILGTLGSDPGNVAGSALRSLAIRNARGTAVRARYWGGTIADCSIGEVTANNAYANPAVQNSATAAIYVDNARNGVALDSVEIFAITSSAPHMVYASGGTGSMTVTNCHFHGLKSTATIPDSNGAFDSRLPLSMQDTTAEGLEFTGGNSESQGIFSTYNVPAAYDRCIFRDIDLSGGVKFAVVTFNRDVAVARISNCLFTDIRSTSNNALVCNFRGRPTLVNCTIDDVSVLASCGDDVGNASSPYHTYLYNSAVSRCGTIRVNRANAATAGLILKNVNLYDTVEGAYGYATNSSVNVTAFDPGFRNAAAGDYRLRSNSPLIDKGDNALVTAAMGGLDLALNPRIQGNGGNPLVDLGCYESIPAFGTMFILR